ncbi:hypothetical protein BB559_006047 [Furculomyces boomerangus]|uniref:Histone-lysine N-methyltransferase n=2 Tax=Harpellales TaxID=61421 RepID=A0A2T9Y532_9FUNG|nr:hypothetical protein BB559_006047 [Furculomyces boomerangus]PWA00741.1 hypothetical protein BB558_003218 [Smittium angustum]
MSSTKATEADAPMPFVFQFAAGAIAGVSEILCMYPLDVVKTRFMLQVGKSEGQYKSIADAFRRIIKEEGPRVLYRGIIPPILVEAPKRAIKFAANDQYGRFYLKAFNQDKMTQPLAIFTGVSAGLTEAVIVSTPELLKIRLQAKENAGRYSGMVDCVKKVYRAEGAMAFFNGMEATMWRHALWNGGYFGSIFLIRDLLPKPESKKGTLFINFVAGAIGGTIGTTLNTPTDVVKTRIQAYMPSQGPKIYFNNIQGILHIAKHEGFSALYKGYVPKVLRLGPGGGILLVVYDQNRFEKLFTKEMQNMDNQKKDWLSNLTGIEYLTIDDITKEALQKFEYTHTTEFVGVAKGNAVSEDSMPCHCKYNQETDPIWKACGDRSECINRLVQMECHPLLCPTGRACQNRRFQKKQYAKVRVIEAGKKGYGLCTEQDLKNGEFVIEYTGEMVSKSKFIQRTYKYDEDGQPHHYFMSVDMHQVIDATAKGNVARFINHSCNPNCILQRWVVGGQIRMGIFAQRRIPKGEELSFDYKFERIEGTEPQPCYCNEPQCKGVIGVEKEIKEDKEAESSDDSADELDAEIEGERVSNEQREELMKQEFEDSDQDEEYIDSDAEI